MSSSSGGRRLLALLLLAASVVFILLAVCYCFLGRLLSFTSMNLGFVWLEIVCFFIFVSYLSYEIVLCFSTRSTIGDRGITFCLTIVLSSLEGRLLN